MELNENGFHIHTLVVSGGCIVCLNVEQNASPYTIDTTC